MLHHVVQLLLHHGIGHIALGGAHHAVHQRLAGGFPGLGIGGLLHLLLQIGAVLGQGVEVADLGGELVIQLGQLLAGDGVQLHMEHRVLALEVLGVILLGEGDVQIALLADGHAHHLLLEAGDEVARADHQRLMLGGAAGKRHAIHRAGVVQLSLVAVFQRAVGHVHAAGHALALLLDAGVHLVGGHLVHAAGHFHALVLTQLDVGEYKHLAGESKVLAGLHLLHVQLGTAHGLEVIVLDGAHVRIGEENFQRILIENAGAVHPLNQLARSLALAEARHADLTAHFQVGLLDGLFKIGGGRLERYLDFVAGQFFHRMFHAFSSWGMHEMPS